VPVELLLVKTIRLFQQFLRIWSESIQEAIGKSLGKMAFLILRDRRAVAISNIRRVFPELNKKGLKEIARGCFVKLGIDFVEFLLIPYLPKAEYPMRFKLHKEVGVEKLMDSGEGIIALAFHFANWEIMGVASVLLKKEIVVLARPLKRHRQINDFLNHLRSSTGLKIIPNADTAMDAIRLLRQGR
jgi:KDO2-lipid IV(A) lauroyltransferase